MMQNFWQAFSIVCCRVTYRPRANQTVALVDIDVIFVVKGRCHELVHALFFPAAQRPADIPIIGLGYTMPEG